MNILTSLEKINIMILGQWVETHLKSYLFEPCDMKTARKLKREILKYAQDRIGFEVKVQVTPIPEQHKLHVIITNLCFDDRVKIEASLEIKKEYVISEIPHSIPNMTLKQIVKQFVRCYDDINKIRISTDYQEALDELCHTMIAYLREEMK